MKYLLILVFASASVGCGTKDRKSVDQFTSRDSVDIFVTDTSYFNQGQMSSDSLADVSGREYYASLLRKLDEPPLKNLRVMNEVDYEAVRIIVRYWVYNPYVINIVKRDSLVTVTVKILGDSPNHPRTGLQNLVLEYSSTSPSMLARYATLHDELTKYDFYNSFDDVAASERVSSDGNAYVLEYDGPRGHLLSRGRKGKEFRGSASFFAISGIMHAFAPPQILPCIDNAQDPSDLLFPVLKESHWRDGPSNSN